MYGQIYNRIEQALYIVTKPTFVFVLETGIPAIRLSFILAERNDL